jgi:protein TonB
MGAAGMSGAFGNGPDQVLTPTSLGAYNTSAQVTPVPPANLQPAVVAAPGNAVTPTPPDVAPALLNADEAARRVQEVYPPELRAAGQKGHVQARLIILASGQADMQTFSVDWSTADSFDEPARKVVEMLRFDPARYADRPEPVWVTLPIDFQP